jgi:precorrin-2 dehydrogenase / sirohydrochlorin ferrochelatase
MTLPPPSRLADPDVLDGRHEPPAAPFAAHPPALRAAPPALRAAPPPLFHLALRLDGEPCLVVGGGPVGARKAASLLECGAVVTVVSPEICALFDDLPVSFARRSYRSGEAAGYRLVVTATGIWEVDREVYLDAEQAGVLVNAADDPNSCSFLMPATLRQGDVSVAVSTGGSSPFLAGWLRRRVGQVVGPEVAMLVAVVGETRTTIRAAGVSSEGLDWEGLVEGALWPLVQAGDLATARSVAARWVEDVLHAGRLAPEAPKSSRSGSSA